MTNETEAPEQGYLICKNGVFYRPDSSGYTSAKAEAGRYSLKDAIYITHPNGSEGPRDGMTYIHESDVPDPRADLSDAQASRIAELEAAYQAARDETYRMAVTATEANARAEAAEANLAEAVDVDLIEQCIRDVLDEGGTIRSAAEYVARATLAELKGGE